MGVILAPHPTPFSQAPPSPHPLTSIVGITCNKALISSSRSTQSRFLRFIFGVGKWASLWWEYLNLAKTYWRPFPVLYTFFCSDLWRGGVIGSKMFCSHKGRGNLNSGTVRSRISLKHKPMNLDRQFKRKTHSNVTLSPPVKYYISKTAEFKWPKLSKIRRHFFSLVFWYGYVTSYFVFVSFFAQMYRTPNYWSASLPPRKSWK